LYNTSTSELVELIGAVISFIAVFYLYKKMVGVK